MVLQQNLVTESILPPRALIIAQAGEKQQCSSGDLPNDAIGWAHLRCLHRSVVEQRGKDQSWPRFSVSSDGKETETRRLLYLL